MKSLTLKLPILRPDQSAIALHPAKVKVVACGRRWGKSTLGGVMSLTAANAGCNVAWVVPTYKRARPLWRFAMQHTAALKKARAVKTNKADMTVSFERTSGMLGIYSDETADSIRGDAFHLVVIDEGAFIKEDTYFDVILPTLADYEGDLLVISSPHGMNWFWRLYQEGLADGQYIASWRAPTVANPSPQIQKAYWKAKEKLPEHRFLQEWDAVFLPGGDGIFQNVKQQATATPQTNPLAGHEYHFGIDTGRIHDATVIAVYDVTLSAIVAIERVIGWSFEKQLNLIDALNKKWKPNGILIEKNNFGFQMTEDLHKMGIAALPFTTTLASKNTIIDDLAVAFQQRLITMIDHEQAIAELHAFEGTQLQSGLYKYGAPSGMFDDCVIAMALAYHGAKVSQSSVSTTPMNLWNESRTMSAHRDAPHAGQHQHRDRHAKRHSVWN